MQMDHPSVMRRRQAGIGLALTALAVAAGSAVPPNTKFGGAVQATASLVDPLVSRAPANEFVVQKVVTFDLGKFGPSSFGD